MKTWQTKLLWSLGGMVMIIAGCATPMVPRNVMSSITQPPTLFREIQKNTDHYIGKTVLWGGTILKVTNYQETTSIEVLQEPTDSDGRHTTIEESQGRFLAEVKGYLDMEVYKRGRQISMTGKVKGQQEQPLGEGQGEYSYPMMAVEHIYLWPETVRLYPVPAYYGPPMWWGGYWDFDIYWSNRWGHRRGWRHGRGYDGQRREIR